MLKIVLLDGDEAAAARFAEKLRSGLAEELTLIPAATTEAALYALAQRTPDCLIIALPGEGSELLHTLHVTYASRLPCATLVVGPPGLDVAVASAFKAGAHEYCPKEASPAELAAAVESCNERYITQLQEQERKELLEYFHQDLERKDQLKSSFVANASHELRTPVSALVGLVSLLEPRVGDEESQALLSTMKACLDGMLIVVDDLLDLTGLESGHIEIRQEPFALGPLVQRTVDSWLPVARDKGVRLTCSYSGELPAAILGDPRRLSQVLFNTLGGALKFSRSAVDLEVVTRIDAAQSTCQVDCEVRVAGVELTDAERRALLDPFPDPSKGLDSAGLGLGVAHTLAQAMQGKLQCENLPGHGILFRFGFSSPVAEAPVLPPVVPASENSDGPRYVLVAEDNPIVAHIISLQLRQLGFEPTVVTDGLQVVDKAQHGGFAAVIMDCQMPRMDGVEATRVLRRTFSSQQLPIVALTASGRAGQAELCLAAGMNDYLIKPATAEQLKQVLARHMPTTRLTPHG